MNTTTTRPASEKQLAFIAKLQGEKALNERQAEMLATELAADSITTARASLLINFLRGLPRNPQASTEQATPGYYKQGEEFIVVVQTRDKQRTYAKRLVMEGGRASWEYAPGVGRTLAGLVPLTLDEAKGFGHMHGVCMVCCKQLTNPASVEAGIGPVCAKRF